MKPQIIKKLLALLGAGTLLTLSPPSWAGVVFTEDFNGYANPTSSSSQDQTALNVYSGGTLSLWTATGGSDVIAVDRSGAGDYALMLYTNSAISLTSGIAANDAGVGYTVAFSAAPAVYDTSSQAKAAVDAMLVQVLRGDGSVLAFWVCNPGAWANPPTWQSFSFKYVGDGTGAVRLKISPLVAGAYDHYAGAIDDLTVTSTGAASPYVASLANDFSYAANNASTTWSYRYDDYTGTPPVFPLLTNNTFNANSLWGIGFPTAPIVWNNGNSYGCIGKNTTGAVQVNSSGGANNYCTWAPGEVLLHPYNGNPGRMVMCWLAPSNMVVEANYSFGRGMPGGNGVAYKITRRHAGVDVDLVANLTPVGAFLSASQTGIGVYGGDQLFFRIDNYNANAGYDVTRAAIQILGSAPPVTLPGITNAPAGGTVAEGCTFILTVGASNAWSYAWYKDDTLIPGAGLASYSLVDASTTNVGSYKVVAANAYGSVTSAPVTLTVTARATHGTVLLSENFNGYSGNQNNLQYQTGLKVATGGNIPGWSKSGDGAIHAEDRTGSGDWAIMFYGGNTVAGANIISNTTPIAANVAGATYYVDFVSGDACYNNGAQANTAADGLVVDVVRADGSVLATYTNQPRSWVGDQSFVTNSFTYVGDGSGLVNIRIEPLPNAGSFQGSIDNLRVATDYVPPTPPGFTAQPVGGNVAEGCNFTFTVGVSNALGMAWYKDNTPIPGAGGTTYSIIDAGTNAAGTYKVVVTNAAFSVTSAPVALTVTARASHPTLLLWENFSGYAGNQNDLQYQTGLKVAYGGNVSSWTKAGSGVIHAVDRTGSGDWAVMFWTDNSITLASGIPANDASVTYFVDFVAGPAVYSNPDQATTAADGLVVDVLRADNSVLATYTCQPGAWAGDESFATNGFTYVGDGTGPVRISVSPLAPYDFYFAGAIDNLRVATDSVLPPPGITDPPAGGNVAEGCNFRFTVGASNAMSYAWYKNGALIPGAANASFSVVDAAASDAASYKAVVANSSGSVTSSPVALTVTSRASHRTVLLSENFSSYFTSTANTLQYQTGLKVFQDGKLGAWYQAGTGAEYAVDRTGSGDYAIMFWQDNSITLVNGINANEASATYYVDFVAGPAVYNDGNQATTAFDGIVVDVLRADDTVLATSTYQPGAWAGDQSFATNGFTYVGDGTGPVRLRLSPLYVSGFFAGAMDNLRVATDYGSAPSPTNITYTVNANQLVLNWPAGQGWLLQSNSVSLAAPNSWFSISGATPPFSITINPTNTPVFYRLKY